MSIWQNKYKDDRMPSLIACCTLRVTAAILMFSAFLIFSACENSTIKRVDSTAFAMDTVLELGVYGEKALTAISSCIKLANDLDTLLSTQNPESAIYAINTASGPITMASEVAFLLEVAHEISMRSEGAFDVTIYPVVNAWGFAGKEYKVPSAKELEEARKHIGYSNIKIHDNIISMPTGMMLDFGGIAKGYAADRMKQILEELDIKSAIISFGGNVLAYGSKPGDNVWRVGIQDPANVESLAAILEVKDSFIVTSGGYQRYFEQDGEKYHHIIDPDTGYPANSGLISVTIVCKDGTRADALSTALFVLGEKAALEYYDAYGGFEAVLLTNKGELICTAGLKSSLTNINTAEYSIVYHE